MQKIETVINAVKSGYLWVVGQIEAHPHWVLWIGLAYVAIRR